jgi:hypothetical protein
MCRAVQTLAEVLVFAAPRSSLNAPIGPRRVLRAVGLDMDRVQRMRRLSDATLDDIALTLVSGALRRSMAGAAEPPVPLRAMIADATIALPVDEPDPLRRLGRMRGELLELQPAGRDVLLRSSSPLPGPVKDRAARLLASPRLHNLVVSSARGPRAPISIAGAQVTELSPAIPLSARRGLAVGVLSYRDTLRFAFHADPEVVAGVEVLPRHLLAAAVELERALGLRPKRGRALTAGGSLVQLRSVR